MGGVVSVEKVDPHTAVDDDHLTERPFRLRSRSPRQGCLPKAASTSRCRFSLIIRRSASSTVCFLVAQPEAFWAWAMSVSSMSILVRIQADPFQGAIGSPKKAPPQERQMCI